MNLESLEMHVRELTTELNGQYPRPWMTDSNEPQCAQVFVVGYNPATAYESSRVDYERHTDAASNYASFINAVASAPA